jgi:hypothetical protein
MREELGGQPKEQPMQGDRASTMAAAAVAAAAAEQRQLAQQRHQVHS